MLLLPAFQSEFKSKKGMGGLTLETLGGLTVGELEQGGGAGTWLQLWGFRVFFFF